MIAIGDGLAVAFKIEIAQPPERRRAVPGRGDRRRRHPARHLHDGRAADRGPRRAPLRRPVRRPDAAPRRRRRARRRRLRQLRRRPDGRRRARVRPVVPGQPARQRHGDRPARGAAMLTLAAAPGPGNLVVLFGSATGRDGIGGASVLACATFARPGPVQAAVRPGRRPVRGEAPHRGVARADREAASSSGSRTSARRASPARRPRPPIGRHRHARRPRRDPAPRARAWSRSRS